MERYAVSATEEKIRGVWTNCLFTQKELLLKDALVFDINSRLQGINVLVGSGAFTEAAVLAPLDATQEQKTLCQTYGGDAFRLALLLEKDLSSETLFPQWRFIGSLWQKLRENKCCVDENVITKYTPKTYLEAQILEDLNKKDFYHAFCGIKTYMKTNCELLPLFLYPFIPFLIQSFYPQIHKIMSVFYKRVQKYKQNPFVKVFHNGKLCGYVLGKKKKDILKEALSLEQLRGKIPSRIIFDKKRVLNVLD